jgi:surface antigen
MKKTAPLILALAGLVAATATHAAFAQGRGNANGAYRNGYEDGYRAGFDDGRRSGRAQFVPPPPAPPPARVVVVDRDARWKERYAHTYTYNDDNFYRECRQSVDPAGVVAGALIGGLLGNVASKGKGGATVAGVIIGGATGAVLTRNLDCDDRSYAYKTYHDGFNAGRANARYEWTNPKNGHRGEFLVKDYYDDPDGFRCANYTQQIFVDGRPQAASGRACQQPDGTWAVVS